jgi:transposase
VNAIFYLLRTGCQWRLLPREFPPWPTVYYYFRRWEQESVWLTLLRSLCPLTRLKSGRRATPSVAIMDGQSVKTTEKGAFGVLTPISGSEEENDYPGRYVRHSDCQPSRSCQHVRSARSCPFARRPRPIFPRIKTVIADAGHQSRKLTRLIKAEGYELRIVKRRKRAFEVVGLTWIVERTFA